MSVEPTVQENSTSPETPTPAAPPPPAEPVALVPRSQLNYVLIGIVFFALGVLVGFVGYDRVAQGNRDENRQLAQGVQDAVLEALDEAGLVDAGPSLNPSERYTVQTEGNPARGNAEAVVTIVEYGDFRCSFCKRFEDTTLGPLLDQYGDRVQLVWLDYPILGQSSFEAALAGACANDQGRFWDFHDLVFSDQASFSRDGFIAKATALELDLETFTTCYDTQVHAQAIAADLQSGQALGVGGTPTFFINGRPLVGAQPIDAFVRIIEEELAANS